MTEPSLNRVLRQHFPKAAFDENDPTLGIGSFSEWDSLAHFNFLMLVEETYDVRFSIEEMSELKNISSIRSALAAHGKQLS